MDEIEASGKENGIKDKKNFTEKFKEWATLDLKMTTLFCLIGFFIGIMVYFLRSNLDLITPILFVITLPIFLAAAFGVYKVFKIKEGKGWWFSKFVVYLFMWIITWTILYNLYTVWA